MQTSKKSTILRLPTELYASLQALAEREHRSVNNEIVHLLTQAISGQSVMPQRAQRKRSPSNV
jgi:hypothetical protein